MDTETTIRETCFFCNLPWGKCVCPALAEGEGFDFKGFIIDDPSTDESGRFYVDPVAHYGEAFTAWRKKITADVNRIWHEHYAFNGPRTPMQPDEQLYVMRMMAHMEPEEWLVASGAYARRGASWVNRPKFPKAFFGFEGGAFGPLVEGYNSGETWNGWKKPLVTRETLEAFVKEFNEAAKEDNLNVPLREIRGDVVYGKCEDEDDYRVEITPVEVETVDGKLKLWDIGAGLTWDTLSGEEVAVARERITKEKK